MKAFEEEGGTIISLTAEQRKQWAASIPDLARSWVEGMEARDLPGRQLLRDYMEIMRANDQPIMRHWDRE
jgi:hypothetical protein